MLIIHSSAWMELTFYFICLMKFRIVKWHIFYLKCRTKKKTQTLQIGLAFKWKRERERERQGEISICCNFTQLQCQILLMGMHDVQIMQTFLQCYVHFLSCENGDYYGKCIILLKSGLWNIHNLSRNCNAYLIKRSLSSYRIKWFCIVFIFVH